MAYYADIYVFKKTRSKNQILAFLDHFLPHREETQDEYFLPFHAEKSSHCFEKVIDLLQHLEKNNQEYYSIYWKNCDENNPNKYGMIFYTQDGYIIFGISRDVMGCLDRKSEEECLQLMLNFFNTKDGYITYEQPPINTYEEFKRNLA